jgi:DNA processing protein
MDLEIQKISFNDELFPVALKNISTPPKELFYYGKIIPNENCFAVVGARVCSKYGQECALEISSQIAGAGLTIVSGLARGIDSFAHTAAVKLKQRTIAVLGTSINNIYPKDNLRLAHEIIENNGLIISEYAPDEKTGAYSFVERNRLISGLALGTLVIEAGIKSGSLITAEYTRKQNKKLFALPGNIHSPVSRGCHELIKTGAILTENIEDILKALNLEHLPKTIKNDTSTATLNEEERKIIGLLNENPLDIETLIKKSELPPNKIMGTLAALEIKNLIIDLGDNTYSLKRI